jgi:hypothetical protein
LPALSASVRTELEDASQAAAVAGEALTEAERRVAAAENEDAARAARRAETQARDHLRMTNRRVEAAEERADKLRRDETAAKQEAPKLEARARKLARLLADRPRLAEDAGHDPAPGLEGVSEWASRARAALFVARGGLAAEREAVIRQANELGSLVLGEPIAASSAAAVARRLESS